MPVLSLPDFAMHYRTHGEGAETIVLIHGNIASTRWWDKFLPLLPPAYTAVFMDLRGCGQSGHPAGGYTIAQFAADVHALVRALGREQFHLVGHSMGGQIAMYYALAHPAAVRTLTLVDSVPAAGLALDDEARRMFDVLRTDKTALRQAVNTCMPFSDDGDFAQLITDDAWQCAPNIYSDNPATMHDTVLLPRIGDIAAPTLIVHGRHDQIIPPDTMASTIAAWPDAQVVWLPACGHSPPIERPVIFSEIFLQFIKHYPITHKEVIT